MLPGGKGNMVGIVIHEGKNRQIHRMFEALDYVVKKLDRVVYADISVRRIEARSVALFDKQGNQ